MTRTDDRGDEASPTMVPAADIGAFLDSWNGVAATLIDRHLTVSATSRLAEALFPNLSRGVNLAREVFLGFAPGTRPQCVTDTSPQVIAALQAALASHEEDDEFRRIVGELSTMSRDFSSAWANGTAPLSPHGILRSSHPTAGELTIRYQLLELATGSSDMLIVWQGADADSESALGRLTPVG